VATADTFSLSNEIGLQVDVVEENWLKMSNGGPSSGCRVSVTTSSRADEKLSASAVHYG
jgi:hypothetical protein